ncbi:unnamed protein product [Meloidogyne enterolobii]|uniref:Uncharacterized protein n=1 Tax=Meloidogyne enterolobii TaxID=390850 RepID=A0ACB0ZX13_MELEN
MNPDQNKNLFKQNFPNKIIDSRRQTCSFFTFLSLPSFYSSVFNNVKLSVSAIDLVKAY